jgi:hypothetical protein
MGDSGVSCSKWQSAQSMPSCRLAGQHLSKASLMPAHHGRAAVQAQHSEGQLAHDAFKAWCLDSRRFSRQRGDGKTPKRQIFGANLRILGIVEKPNGRGDPASPHQPKFKHFRHAITSSLEKTEALSFSSSTTSIPVFPALYRLSYTCYTSFLPDSTMTGYSQLWKRLSPRQLNLAIQIFCKFHLLSFSYFLLLAIALLA